MKKALRNRLIIFWILMGLVTWGGGAWASGVTNSIYYNEDTTEGYLLNKALSEVHANLSSSAQKTLRYSISTGDTSNAHHIMSFTVPVDSSGLSGVPSGRTIESVTLYVTTSGNAYSGANLEAYDVNVTPNSPTWEEYSSGNGWTLATDSNDAHISDATLIATATTTGTSGETFAMDISSASDVPATMSGSFTVTILTRMQDLAWCNVYTTGTSRYRVVVTYSGSQPPTPTPTSTNTPTSTPTYTASNTPTNTPTPTSAPATNTPVPTAFKVVVSATDGYDIPISASFTYDAINERLKIWALEFGDGSTATSATGSLSSATRFEVLSDVFTFASNALKVPRVNAAETALEAVSISSIAAQPTHVHNTDDLTEGSTNKFQDDEADQDMINGFLINGTNITKSYDDDANTLQLNFSGSVGETNGGTGQSTYTTGDMLYSDGSNSIGKLSIGTAGQVLKVGGGVPTWANLAGSNLSGLTDNHVLWGNSSGAIGSEAALWYDDSTNRLGIGGSGSPDYTLDVEGNAGFDEYLYHNGDTDTYQRYQDDRLTWVIGNLTMLDFKETTQDIITLGNAAGDVDINLNNDLSITGSDGSVDINNDLNVDGTLRGRTHLISGENGAEDELHIGASQFQPEDSGSTFNAGTPPFWQNGSTGTEEYYYTMDLPFPGSVIESLTFHVYTTDASDAFSFYLYDVDMDLTDGPSTTATPISSAGNTSASGLSSKGSNYYYKTFTINYTMLADGYMILKIVMDPNSTVGTMRFFAVDILLQEREY